MTDHALVDQPPNSKYMTQFEMCVFKHYAEKQLMIVKYVEKERCLCNNFLISLLSFLNKQ